MRINITIIVFLVSILNSCSTGKDINSNIIGKLNLLENNIEGTNYFISLPEDYFIDKYIGPDFYIYYINSKNAEVDKITYGGLYLGNHPSLFSNDKEENLKLVENVFCKVFNKKRKWKVYNNDNNYIAEIIIRNNNGEEWEKYMHIWANGKTKNELYEIIYLYSTINNHCKI